MKHSKNDLIQFQSLPLSAKVRMTAARIEGWYQHWNSYRADAKDNDPTGIYLSFSGGKDSTALLHLIKNHCIAVYDCPAVFVDTGLEYPEIRTFAIEHADEVLRPEMPFNKVIAEYGYPVIGKEVAETLYYARKGRQWAIQRINGESKTGERSKFRERFLKYKPLLDAPFEISSYCCNVMKKHPCKKYERETKKVPIIATMACESQLRQAAWLKTGCNTFYSDRPKSTPMAFWTEQDVLEYLITENVPFASVYGEIKQDSKGKFYTTGAERTGCMFCAFGAHLEKPYNRFERMRLTHPKQYEYCMRPTECGGLGMAAVLEYIGVKY